MCVMQRHVPCNMCQGSGCRPSPEGFIPRTERVFLFLLRCVDSARAVLLSSPLFLAPFSIPSSRLIKQGQVSSNPYLESAMESTGKHGTYLWPSGMDVRSALHA